MQALLIGLHDKVGAGTTSHEASNGQVKCLALMCRARQIMTGQAEQEEGNGPLCQIDTFHEVCLLQRISLHMKDRQAVQLCLFPGLTCMQAMWQISMLMRKPPRAKLQLISRAARSSIRPRRWYLT